MKSHFPQFFGKVLTRPLELSKFGCMFSSPLLEWKFLIWSKFKNKKKAWNHHSIYKVEGLLISEGIKCSFLDLQPEEKRVNVKILRARQDYISISMEKKHI